MTFLPFYYERWHLFVELATGLAQVGGYTLQPRADCLIPDDGRAQVLLMLSAFYAEQFEK